MKEVYIVMDSHAQQDSYVVLGLYENKEKAEKCRKSYEGCTSNDEAGRFIIVKETVR